MHQAQGSGEVHCMSQKFQHHGGDRYCRNYLYSNFSNSLHFPGYSSPWISSSSSLWLCFCHPFRFTNLIWRWLMEWWASLWVQSMCSMRIEVSSSFLKKLMRLEAWYYQKIITHLVQSVQPKDVRAHSMRCDQSESCSGRVSDGLGIVGLRALWISNGGQEAAVTAWRPLISSIQMAQAWFQIVPSDAQRFLTDFRRSTTSGASQGFPWQFSGFVWGCLSGHGH